jgi:hypothetical protein
MSHLFLYVLEQIRIEKRGTAVKTKTGVHFLGEENASRLNHSVWFNAWRSGCLGYIWAFIRRANCFDNKRVQLHVSLICQMPTNVSNLAAL